MKNKFKYHVLNMKCQVALLGIMLLFACNNSSNWKETESGLQYIIHLDKKGTKAHIGDGLQLHLIYKNAFDSVLYDSKVLGNAFVMELTEPLFQGSIEEGFAMMGEGDSASFLVVADSVYKNVFQTVMPPQMAPGMRLRIDVRINKILTPTQYKAFIKEQQGPQGDETTLIQKYMADNQVSGSPDANGLYFISFVDGTGKQPQKGNICEVSYLVRALSGQVFDASEKG